ncbi:site-specific integrase [Demequina sp.]|uniref:site-specific integrase n=1 Tax=Demequina sp. TaxID=2050685 RepID=UPI003A88AD57
MATARKSKRQKTHNYPEDRRSWGSVRPSGRTAFQASYTGPDRDRHKGPHTFSSKAAAGAWLLQEKALIEAGTWTPPTVRAIEKALAEQREARVTLEGYGRDWVATHPLHDSTRRLYLYVLERHVFPALGHLPLTHIDPIHVREWYANAKQAGTAARPLEQAYSTLRSLMSTAVKERLISSNPCTLTRVIKPASKKAGAILTAAELDAAGDAMCTVDDDDALRAAGRNKLARAAARGINHPEWRALILLSGWCALRTEELQALQRRHLDLRNGVVHVEQAAYYLRPDHNEGTEGEWRIGPVKGEGERTVTIPPHILPALRQHIDNYCKADPEAWVFLPQRELAAHLKSKLRHKSTDKPGAATPPLKLLSSSTVHGAWKRALAMVGAPDIPFHHLRHTGASLASRAGATTAEVMARLGHSTPRTAMIYQHSTVKRQETIAGGLSELPRD